MAFFYGVNKEVLPLKVQKPLSFPLNTLGFDSNFTLSIFVWPWNENMRTSGFWLVQRTFGWKNVMPENFVEINRYFTLTSYCNTIGQSNNAFSILGFSLAGKRRVHVLIFSSIGWLKKITNIYRNHLQGHTKSLYPTDIAPWTELNSCSVGFWSCGSKLKCE